MPEPDLQKMEAKAAETSVAPVDFANASPFRGRKRERDPIRTAVLAVVAIAVLTFLGSMIAVFTMSAPRI